MRSVLILTYLWIVDASAWASNLDSLTVRQDPSVTSGILINDERAPQEGLSAELSTSYHPGNALRDDLSGPARNDMPSTNKVPVAFGSNSIGPGPELTATKTECSSGNDHPQGGGQARKRKRRRDSLKRGQFCPALLDAPTTTNQHPETERQPIGKLENPNPSETEQSEPDLLQWPDPFKISTQNGDSPACFEQTRGLLPIGVCESLGTVLVPSRFDVYERKNPDIIPKAWRLNDCFLSWPGTDQCFPRGKHGLWCCKRYRLEPGGDGPGRADICLPLHIILQTNAARTSDFVDVFHPLLLP